MAGVLSPASSQSSAHNTAGLLRPPLAWPLPARRPPPTSRRAAAQPCARQWHTPGPRSVARRRVAGQQERTLQRCSPRCTLGAGRAGRPSHRCQYHRAACPSPRPHLAARDAREDGCIHHAQPIHTMHSQLVVDGRGAVGSAHLRQATRRRSEGHRRLPAARPCLLLLLSPAALAHHTTPLHTRCAALRCLGLTRQVPTMAFEECTVSRTYASTWSSVVTAPGGCAGRCAGWATSRRMQAAQSSCKLRGAASPGCPTPASCTQPSAQAAGAALSAPLPRPEPPPPVWEAQAGPRPSARPSSIGERSPSLPGNSSPSSRSDSAGCAASWRAHATPALQRRKARLEACVRQGVCSSNSPTAGAALRCTARRGKQQPGVRQS